MGDIWRPQNPDVLKSWVDTLIMEASDKLSDWEMRFVENIATRLNLGQVLTQTQESKLEQIYSDKTS